MFAYLLLWILELGIIIAATLAAVVFGVVGYRKFRRSATLFWISPSAIVFPPTFVLSGLVGVHYVWNKVLYGRWIPGTDTPYGSTSRYFIAYLITGIAGGIAASLIAQIVFHPKRPGV